MQIDTSLTNQLSKHDLQVANAAGILPLLNEFITLKTTSREGNDREILRKRQQITNRVFLASIQISIVAAELDCEAERAYRLVTYLQQIDSKRIQRLTVLSVVVGALTTVATAFIPSDTPNKTVSIGGGVTSAILAAKAAFSSNRTIHLVHQRNLLTDIWDHTQRSSVYPSFVWYVLNEKSFSYGGQPSISFNATQRWVNYD